MSRKQIKKAASLALACLICLLSLTMAACSSSDTAMSYKGKSISESDYAYVMAFLKGYYEYQYSQMASYYGSQISLEQMYDYEMSEGVTFEKQLIKTIDESCMMMLVVEQLCDELGLKIQDEETLAQIRDAIQQLRDDYGGEDALEIELAKRGFTTSALERYERYSSLLTLLHDYRYGDNGIARIPDEDVLNSFQANYVKAEGYVYSFRESDGNGGSVARVVDLTKDLTDAQILVAFLRLFVKVEYLSYEHQAEAEAAMKSLSEGTAPADLYGNAKTHLEPACILKTEADNGLYKNVETNGEWTLVTEEDGCYVVRRSEVVDEDLQGMEQTVREAVSSELAQDYFKKEYVTVQHILYDLADEEKAKSVYEGLKAGTTTFDEHKSETKDSGTKYTFTKGRMASEFETDSFTLKENEYALTKTTYGWHVIQRLPLDLEGYDENDVLASMSASVLREEAGNAFAQLKDRTSSEPFFTSPEDGAAYTYSEPTVLNLTNLNERLAEALKAAKEGEVVRVELNGYGVYILHRLSAGQEDVEKVKSEILSPLESEAFHNYLTGFYDQVTVNQNVLDRFNVRTAESFYY